MVTNEFEEVKEIVAKSQKYIKEEDFIQARILLEKGLEEFSDNYYLKNKLADVYSRLHLFHEATNLLEEVLSKRPSDHGALTVKGNIAFNKRDYKKAVQLYEAAYRSRKTLYSAQRLIFAYNRLEKYEEALSICQEILEEDPGNPSFLKLKANILHKMDNLEQAEELYNNYLDKIPEDEFAYREMIKIKLEAKEPEAQIRELKQLLRVVKGKKKFEIHKLLGEELYKLKRYKEALEEYEQAFKLEDGDRQIRTQIGFCLSKMDEKEKALPYLKQAFKEDPNDYYVKSSLYACFDRLNKQEEGIAFFREIIEENPNFKNLWGYIKKLSKGVDKKDE